MSYAYSHGNPANSSRSSNRNHFVEPPSLMERLSEASPPWIRQWTAELRAGRISSLLPVRRIQSWSDLQAALWTALKSIFTIANGLIVLWLFTLWWGERTVFQESVETCVWGNWEKWVSLTLDGILKFCPGCLLTLFGFLASRCHAASCRLYR